MFFCKTLLHIAADYKTASDPFLEQADAGLFRKQLKKRVKSNSAILRYIIYTETCHLRHNTHGCHQYFKYWVPNWLSNASQQFPFASLLERKQSGWTRIWMSPFSTELAWDQRLTLLHILSETKDVAGAKQLALANQEKKSVGYLHTSLIWKNNFIIPTWGCICLFIVSNFCTQGKY